MPEIILLLVGLTLVALVGYAIYRKIRLDSEEFNRRFDFSEEGIMERKHNQPIQFEGVGAQTTRPFKLEGGDHKIRYHFPDDLLVKVELLSVEDGDGEMIVLKSGRGEASFSVSTGRYLLDVEPPDDDTDWKLEINRLGLPSGYKREP